MDLESTFNDVLSLAQEANDAGAGWVTLVRYLEEHTGESLRKLADLDIERDVDNVRRQIQELVSSEPPPSDLDAVYFGLFDALDDDAAEVAGYYLAGVKGFDPTDGDSLCDPAWWPEGRYLVSEVLNAVKEAELSASVDGQTNLRAFLGYAGQLGGGLLISKFAAAGLFPGYHYVVGLDEGDFAEITT